MKQLIIPIAIIATLIAFFVVADRREFNRTDDVQTVQNESATINRKPFVSAPQAKPPTEAKLVEFSSNENIDRLTDRQTGRQTGVKPAETKSDAETKPAAETKSEAKPAAVPVATPEEAEKHNEDAKAYALAEKDRKEPFFKFYEDSKFDSVCFQGTVRATSTIPDPEKNDYDNCLYALFIEIDSLLSDATAETKIACEAIVNVPIMRNKTILSDNMFLPGDKIWCSCVEYDEMPQAIQEIQLSDDIQSYEHQQYYPFGIKKISAFQNGGNRNFAKREITILPIQSLPRDEKAAALRKERIQNEIVRIEEEIKKHGGSFEKWKEEYKPIAEKYKDLSKKEWSGWINDSYFAACGYETAYKTKQYIDGILPYKQYLEQNNIDLIVLRVPSQFDFARVVLASESFQENPAWIEHYYECLKNDIEIVDPMPEMWKQRFDFPLFYFYNTVNDPHPFEGYSFVSAKVLSDILKRYSFFITDQPIEIQDCVFQTTQPRYFWPNGNAKYDPQKNISFKCVIQKGNMIGRLRINSGSPFLFVSNSFFAFPMRDFGASVPGYTAFFLQHIPDWSYQEGIGNAMIRNTVSDSPALSNRKAVIMVGHPDYWNGAFPVLPPYIVNNVKSISLEKSLDFISSDITIHDNNSFTFEKDQDGITHIQLNRNKVNPNKSFKAELSIPSKNKTCMLRISFAETSFTYLTVIIKDANTAQTIDQTSLPPAININADFFISIPTDSRQIEILFNPLLPEYQFSIKNIELWYY